MPQLRLRPASRTARTVFNRRIRLVSLAATGVLVITGLDIATLHADQLVSPHPTTIYTPLRTPEATPSPTPASTTNFTVVPTANVNIHSTPDATSTTNFVVTAWQGRPVTVLSVTDANWYYVSYLTTDGQTVTGYILRQFTTTP